MNDKECFVEGGCGIFQGIPGINLHETEKSRESSDLIAFRVSSYNLLRVEAG
jgi:hypothetical protein